MMRSMTAMACWFCLSLWLAASLTAAGAAIGIFSTMPDLHVTLADYAHLSAEDQSRLAAGMLTEPIFFATDLIQLLFSVLLLAGVVMHWCLKMGRDKPRVRLVWTAAIGISACMLWWRVVMIMPSMNQELRTYRDAAANGALDVAEQAKVAFDAMHPIASTMMELGTSLLILALLAGALSSVPRRKPDES